ncbi:hypothetical protein CYY_003506 [Polysphondylium violaceum]|uniref:Uncharacterized protein n=1 Tax=Polysphondylium violaceum TaxID=133409 RepID=A0A8J4PWX3_9MYCE|nr:hypothetical protein CYY_003506 [Polysphondylium violaceum]
MTNTKTIVSIVIVLVLILNFSSFIEAKKQKTKDVGKLSPDNAIDFLYGAFKGIEAGVNPISDNCFNYTDPLVITLKSIASSIIGTQELSPSEINAAILDLISAIQDIIPNIDSCVVPQILDRITEILTFIKDKGIRSFVAKETSVLIINKNKVVENFRNFFVHWNQGKFGDAGRNIGDVLGVFLQSPYGKKTKKISL